MAREVAHRGTAAGWVTAELTLGHVRCGIGVGGSGLDPAAAASDAIGVEALACAVDATAVVRPGAVVRAIQVGVYEIAVYVMQAALLAGVESLFGWGKVVFVTVRRDGVKKTAFEVGN